MQAMHGFTTNDDEIPNLLYIVGGCVKNFGLELITR